MEADSSPPIDSLGIKRVQGIVGALLHYARVVNNKLLVVLSAIEYQQDSATECNLANIIQLVDYVSTYPNDGITYIAICMVLAGHYGTSSMN